VLPVIKLSHLEPAATGGEKLIYFHPEDDASLIKVMNPSYREVLKNRHPFLITRRRLPYYRFFMELLTEHVTARDADIEGKHFIENITGLVDTDMGMGLVTTAIKGVDGNLAMTLGKLLKLNAFNATHWQAVNELADCVTHSPLILRDLWIENIVWNEQEQHFVIVDGIGNNYRPSMRPVSRRYNHYSNRKRAAKLIRRVRDRAPQIEAFPVCT